MAKNPDSNTYIFNNEKAYHDYENDNYNNDLDSQNAGKMSMNNVPTNQGDTTNDETGDLAPKDEEIPGGMATVSVLVVSIIPYGYVPRCEHLGILNVSVLCFLILVFGLMAMFRRKSSNVPSGSDYLYSAAIQNRQFTVDDRDVSCLNCRLIEMGSMACYQELCPQCGRPPPR